MGPIRAEFWLKAVPLASWSRSVSEEHEIYTNYDGCHRHRVKHSSYLSAHFSQHSPDDPMLERTIAFF
jgi:hypothetical protein